MSLCTQDHAVFFLCIYQSFRRVLQQQSSAANLRGAKVRITSLVKTHIAFSPPKVLNCLLMARISDHSHSTPLMIVTTRGFTFSFLHHFRLHPFTRSFLAFSSLLSSLASVVIYLKYQNDPPPFPLSCPLLSHVLQRPNISVPDLFNPPLILPLSSESALESETAL